MHSVVCCFHKQNYPLHVHIHLDTYTYVYICILKNVYFCVLKNYLVLVYQHFILIKMYIYSVMCFKTQNSCYFTVLPWESIKVDFLILLY